MLEQEGVYTAIVTFAASSGKSVSVNITVQVRSADGATDDDNAGYHYIQLRNADNFKIVDEIGVGEIKTDD
ncbi:MAG: hypothetical protein LBJ21_03220, partial [Acidobacteriota bacterium]|jgi:hypothetical protein|nr:hypothetical protein [Acidobacteriota bacterium]